MLLSGWQQALTVLLAVVPGFVYQGARAHFRGPTPDEREISVRVLRALALSGIFVLSYVMVLGSSLTSKLSDPVKYLENPRWTAFWALVMVFVIPFLVAMAVHVVKSAIQLPDFPWTKFFRIYNTIPTAWDFANDRLAPGFVRVLTKEGLWVGGYAGVQSFLTSYPETREIFVEEAWELDNDGAFLTVDDASAGMWIRCDDAQLVQFLRPITPPPPDGTP
ncbi:DUF6338 family protein [Rhodococcus qingshengii]|uniref:DUF6338 family protein n=1 Tax=Rhodococcus qingshengii TaxID=334542 RepID=UPI0002B7BE59|nr:DUF6338 family protein [Rhodococcus qingshengii]EME19362.1 hypothetical protein G418_17690 [Rhodococcus qingshengii BKS 20-40]